MANDKQTFTAVQQDMMVRNLVVTGTLSTAQSMNGDRTTFLYVATGAEGASFVVAFPSVRPSLNYIARATCAGVADFLVFDCPQSQYQADRCRLDCSAAPTAGDIIAITVEDLS